MHGRRNDADADTVDGNWKLGVDWKCTDMRTRLSDWLATCLVRDAIASEVLEVNRVDAFAVLCVFYALNGDTLSSANPFNNI